MLFQDIVQQSRSLRDLQTTLVTFARTAANANANADSLHPALNQDQEAEAEAEKEERGYALAGAERQLEAILTDLAVALNNLGSVHSARLEHQQAEVRCEGRGGG